MGTTKSVVKVMRIINERIQTITCASIQEEAKGKGRNEVNPQISRREGTDNI